MAYLGKVIIEDIINFINLNNQVSQEVIEQISREVAFEVLESSRLFVSSENQLFLESAIAKVNNIQKTPILDKRLYIDPVNI